MYKAKQQQRHAKSCGPPNQKIRTYSYTYNQTRTSNLLLRIRSSILHNSDLRRPQHPSIQPKSLLLRVETRPILLVRLRRLEHSFVHIRIELLT
jgi:hypothetical protein